MRCLYAILICAGQILVSEALCGEVVVVVVVVGGSGENEEKDFFFFFFFKNRRVVVLATSAATLLAGKMKRWLKRKSVPDSQQQQGSQDQPPEPPPEKRRALAGPTPAADKGSRLRKYQPDFLKYGFSCTTKNSIDYPQCVICSEVLAHESLKPVKLKRHLESKHSSLINKPIDYFQRRSKI